MKKISILAASAILSASAAFAGGMDAPVMEEPVMAPEVIVEESSGTSAGGWIVPVIAIVFVAAALS